MQEHCTIPLGICQCGCGNPTHVASQSFRHRGWIKGQHLRFIHGHTSLRPCPPKLAFVCQHCTNIFYVVPSKARNRKYCSISCQHAARSARPEEHFWAKVTKKEPDDCWPWNGPVHGSGYGALDCHIRNQHVHGAHRVAYTLLVEAIPPGLCVLHHCDNRICVNPKHLFLGTIADNHRDMVSKGRHYNPSRERRRTPCADNPPNPKLTSEQVREIRRLYDDESWSKTTLASKYNVHCDTIRHIIQRKSWVKLA